MKGCENKVMFSWEQVFCYEEEINNEDKHCIKKKKKEKNLMSWNCGQSQEMLFYSLQFLKYFINCW